MLAWKIQTSRGGSGPVWYPRRRRNEIQDTMLETIKLNQVFIRGTDLEKSAGCNVNVSKHNTKIWRMSYTTNGGAPRSAMVLG